MTSTSVSVGRGSRVGVNQFLSASCSLQLPRSVLLGCTSQFCQLERFRVFPSSLLGIESADSEIEILNASVNDQSTLGVSSHTWDFSESCEFSFLVSELNEISSVSTLMIAAPGTLPQILF